MGAFGLEAISQEVLMIIRWNFTSRYRNIFCTKWYQ